MEQGHLAAELTVFRGQRFQSWRQAPVVGVAGGVRICLGFFVAIFVALVAVQTRKEDRADDAPYR